MTIASRFLIGFFVLVLLGLPGFGQSSMPLSTPSEAPASGTPAPGQSLADIARSMRKNKQAEVQMTPADAKELFQQVDQIFEFASDDTGLARRAPIKRRLISESDVEKFFKERLAKQEYAQRFARAELTMKKFGLLPRDFDLREFLVKANGQQVAGFYDDETKVISLLNWIPIEQQEPILAHELTHALQDQNFDLRNWAKAGMRPARANGRFQIEDEESVSARRAVAEGQAMVVYYDYLLAPMNRTLKDTPGIVASMEDPAVTAAIDTPIMHNAPIVLRESGTFPYRDGLFFEAALLEHGGKQLAFTGALAHPPRSTHEVLQPDAYLTGEKLAGLHVPDLRPIVSGKYELYDSGAFGELDVRALLKQYGEKRAAADLTPAWRGGAYVAFRKTGASVIPGSAGSPADVAMIYISRWRTADAAQKFAKLYAAAVAKRYKTAQPKSTTTCSGTCALGTEISTEEGPVIIEAWADNTLVISESFDETTAGQLRDAVLDKGTEQSADLISPQELSLRLYELPAFREFSMGLQARILGATVTELRKTQSRR
ncbi:MAG: hypothetical protein DMG68_17140 [Acidobacteria bacterium]|nr:MAG: hypothetical protein DMG68_17140 [Acidobacteriota bacterium]